MSDEELARRLASLSELGERLSAAAHRERGDRAAIEAFLTGAEIPEDLRAICLAVVDLAYYRDVPIADDLASSVAFELQDRVSKLPAKLLTIWHVDYSPALQAVFEQNAAALRDGGRLEDVEYRVGVLGRRRLAAGAVARARVGHHHGGPVLRAAPLVGRARRDARQRRRVPAQRPQREGYRPDLRADGDRAVGAARQRAESLGPDRMKGWMWCQVCKAWRFTHRGAYLYYCRRCGWDMRADVVPLYSTVAEYRRQVGE